MNELIGLISLAIAVISYSLYITHTLKGYTKPHAITWLVWGLLNGSVFFEQLAGGAGPGAWVTAAAAVAEGERARLRCLGAAFGSVCRLVPPLPLTPGARRLPLTSQAARPLPLPPAAPFPAHLRSYHRGRVRPPSVACR